MRYDSSLDGWIGRTLLSAAVLWTLGACDQEDGNKAVTRMDASFPADASPGDTQATPTVLATLVVPGKANPWLAGVPEGGTASGGDQAPAQSPVLVPNVVPGMRLSFAATGGVQFQASPPAASPDGDVGGGTHAAENGISGSTTPWNSMLGVFLGPEDPRESAAPPSTLNFLSGQNPGTSFSTLAPAKKQIFFIGDGKTGTGVGETQIFTVPEGATRLYLGTSDGSGWYNNVGEIEVTVTAFAN